MRPLFHRRIEFEPITERIGDVQGTALIGPVDEAVDQPVLGKEAARLVEIVFVADLEAEPCRSGRVRLAQHQRMMLMLLTAAQVSGGVVAVFDMQANDLVVKLDALVQIDDVEHHMAGADDVERRIEHVLRHRHWRGPQYWMLVATSFRGAPSGANPESRDRGHELCSWRDSGFARWRERPGMTRGEASHYTAPSFWILCVPRASETCLVSM